MDRVCKFLNDEPTLINWNTSHRSTKYKQY